MGLSCFWIAPVLCVRVLEILCLGVVGDLVIDYIERQWVDGGC